MHHVEKPNTIGHQGIVWTSPTQQDIGASCGQAQYSRTSRRHVDKPNMIGHRPMGQTSPTWQDTEASCGHAKHNRTPNHGVDKPNTLGHRGMVCTSPTRLDTEPWLGQGQHYRAPRHGVDKPTVRRNQPLCRELLDERNQILPTITTNPYPWELYNVPKIHLDTNKYIHIHSQGLQFLPFIRTKYIYIYKHKRKRTHIHKTLIHKVKILSRTYHVHKAFLDFYISFEAYVVQ